MTKEEVFDIIFTLVSPSKILLVMSFRDLCIAQIILKGEYSMVCKIIAFMLPMVVDKSDIDLFWFVCNQVLNFLALMVK